MGRGKAFWKEGAAPSKKQPPSKKPSPRSARRQQVALRFDVVNRKGYKHREKSRPEPWTT
eukprot:8225884-Pyramimonas_sp.AAC.1